MVGGRMNGRQKHDILINERTKNKLKELPDCVTEWYYNLLASDLTSNTCNDYVNKVALFINYCGSKDLSEIKQSTVDKYFIFIREKEVDGTIVETSDSYRQTTWCALNKFFEFLHTRNYISTNYVKQIVKPKNRDLERINQNRIYLTKKDFKHIIDAARNGRVIKNRLRNETILTILMATGMRIAALVSIDVDDIDFENKTLTVIDKGTKRHLYYLSDQVVDILNSYVIERNRCALIQEKGLFISKTTGERMSIESVKEVVERCTKNALGKKLSPHKLRAGFCSILYKETHDIEFVRRAVGHSDIKTTQRYISVDDTERRKASTIMNNIFE